MIARRLIMLSCCFAFGCGGEREPAETDAAQAARTRQERDSALAESRVPGARGVGEALETSGAARERAAQMDSIQP